MSVGVGQDFLNLIEEQDNTTPSGVGQDFLNLIGSDQQQAPQEIATPSPDIQAQGVETSPIEQEQAFESPRTAGVTNLLRKASGVGEQFQKGVAVQEKELFNLLGVNTRERLPDVEDPQGIAQKGARFAGEVLAPSPALANIPGASFAATRISSLVADKSAKVLKPIAKLAKKSVSFVGEALSSVPREFFERAIKKEAQGKSIFAGVKPKFKDIGKKVQKAMNFVSNQAGEEVGAEKAALKGKKIFIPIDGIIKSIDDKIAEKTIDEFTTLDNNDIEALDGFRKLLIGKSVKEINGKKFLDAGKLNLFKKKMQNMAKFDLESVKKTSSEGKGIMKAVSGEIKTLVNKAVPELGEVNAKFSKIADLKQRLKVDLKDKNVATNIKNLLTGTEKKEFTKQLFKELDEIAPKDLKFFDELSDAIVRDSFDSLFPGKGGGSGGAQGFANLLRIGGIGANLPGLLPLVSPKVQGAIIKGVGKASRGVAKGKRLLKGNTGNIGNTGVAGRQALQIRKNLKDDE